MRAIVSYYTGYEYARYIITACEELQSEIGVIPAIGQVYYKDITGNYAWRKVLCHPDDKEEDDESKFKHPYRDF